MGFDNLILNDPSEGGADMSTTDGRILFENRLLTITGAMDRHLIERQVQFQLGKLMARLSSDLVYYRKAERGYAFLSFVENGGIETMMFEMTR